MDDGVHQEKPVRVLIADDYAPWRAQVHAMLQASPELQVIGEACDGSEAVQMTKELLPDVVVLDVGMPALNGIEAAEIICQRCPKSKILFVTQDGDAEVRNAAMRVGAAAYVLKANAAHELLKAIAAALASSPPRPLACESRR